MPTAVAIFTVSISAPTYVMIIIGVGEYLKTRNPEVQVVLADPQVRNLATTNDVCESYNIRRIILYTNTSCPLPAG